MRRFSIDFGTLLVVGSVCLAAGTAQAEINIVSPIEEEGNISCGGGPAFRGQFLYPDEDFMSLPDSHRTISAISFQSDGANTFSDPVAGPARYILSTTDADELIPGSNFEDNLDDDQQLVFEGILTWQANDFGEPPRDFEFVVPLNPRFTYDPNAGNLLVDFVAPDNWDVVGKPQIDGHTDSTGPITLLGSFDPTADFAEIAFPALWSTQFTFVREPSTSVSATVSLLCLARWRRRKI